MNKFISRILGRRFQIEKAKGLAKEFYLNHFKLRFTLWLLITRGCNRLPVTNLLSEKDLKGFKYFRKHVIYY